MQTVITHVQVLSTRPKNLVRIRVSYLVYAHVVRVLKGDVWSETGIYPPKAKNYSQSYVEKLHHRQWKVTLCAQENNLMCTGK